MKCNLSLTQRLKLELNKSVGRVEVLEHKLRQIFWECTLRCNLNCLHCGSDCRMVSDTSDMPLEKFLNVLDSRPETVNPKDITIITTGGEPLVRADIVECGHEFVKRGFYWGMVTNGMLLTQDKLNELMDNGLATLAMSFDGFESEHNWMRGNAESFRRVDAAVGYLARTDSLVWDIITCVNRRNFDSIRAFRDYIINKGVRNWRLFTIVKMGRAVENDELHLSDSQFVELMDFIVETRREGRIHVDFSCEGFLGRYEGEVRDYYYNCHAGVSIASVLNDGSISGCLSIRSNYHQGNIGKDDFWKVWENGFEQYRNRSWMKKDQCATCEAWRFCLGNGMHLRDDNGKLLSCNYMRIKNADNDN